MASTALDYFVGAALARTTDARARRGWLIVSLVANLGTIAFFKYYNFFVTSAAALLEWLGLPASLHTLNIVIPVGVSFYTFHSMSYTIDVYRGKLRPVTNLLDLACFIGFFPQMVAGPIVRAFAFLPQLRTREKIRRCRCARARSSFFSADSSRKPASPTRSRPLSIAISRRPGISPPAAPGSACSFTRSRSTAISPATPTWRSPPPGCSGTSCRSISASRISRGTSPISGIAGTSVLSTWLRDYLYIPLGGNRGPRWFVFRNIMITMLLGGLWHGGAWTFVIWGGLHGLALVVHREWSRRDVLPHVPDSPRRVRPARAQAILRWLAWPLTIYWVCVAWIFFRAVDLKHAVPALESFVLFRNHGGEDLGTWMLWIVAALALVHWLNSRGWFSQWWRAAAGPGFRGRLRLRRSHRALIYSAALRAVHLLSILSLEQWSSGVME